MLPAMAGADDLLASSSSDGVDDSDSSEMPALLSTLGAE